MLGRQVYGSYMARQRELQAKHNGGGAGATTLNFVLNEFERKLKK
jgi:hypothetical protein